MIEFFLSKTFACRLIVLYKKFINLLLFLTDAILRAPRRPSIVIPIGSRVYVQMLGTRVLSGILQILENDPGDVYVRRPDGVRLIANLENFPHNSTHLNNEFRCYVSLPDRTVLATFLHPYNPELHALESMAVLVRVPGHPLFAGRLRRGEGHRPDWLP